MVIGRTAGDNLHWASHPESVISGGGTLSVDSPSNIISAMEFKVG